MITPADDYPLHQNAEAIAFSGTDRNFYDRFFFNGFQEDLFFAVALGVYPQLNIMDAAFCVSFDGIQYNLRFSKEMNMDRINMQIGAFNIEIVKPLAITKIKIDENQYGIGAELIATKRHLAVEEPRFIRRNGSRAFMDYTRLTQNVDWSGHIKIKGKEFGVSNCLGTRDRSWGVRPIGQTDPQPTIPPMEPQFYWLWTPSNFDKHSLFFHTSDDADGKAWNRRAVIVDIAKESQTHFDNVKVQANYLSNSRRIKSVHVEMADGMLAELKTTDFLFYMNGLGYTHPQWGHGTHHGPLAEAFDEIDLSKAEQELASGAFHNLHVQALSEIRLTIDGADYKGLGVVEQLFIGNHKTSGLE